MEGFSQAKEAARDNITLIGMPASGKSTVGIILAKVLAYDFVDTDLLIQRSEKRSLASIISEEGVDRFIEIENRIGTELTCTRTVIATGGSAVYGREAMEHYRSIGVVVYLKVSYETIEQRLHNIHSRGVVLREGQTLRDLYEERTRLYEKYANIIIEEQGGVEDEIVAIVRELSM